jgi:hypothetical protein
MFCYQQSFFNPTRVVGCEQFWALVGAPRTRELIDGIRQEKAEAARLLQAGDKEGAKEHEQEAARLKKKLPAFIFQATFDVTKSKKGFEGAWRKQAATRLNGLVVIDIDHVDAHPLLLPKGGVIEKPTPQDYYNVWRETHPELFANQTPLLSGGTGGGPILLVYVTPSGFGLKVVSKADPQKGNLIDNQLAMARELGMKVDESCKDASRMSFICKKEDILFINEQELFTYENKEFGEKYNEQYRRGNSQPTLPFADDDEPRGDHANGDNGKVDGGETAAQADENHQQGSRTAEDLMYHGVSYADIIREWLGGSVPQPGDRHVTLLRLAKDLRYICDRNAEVVRRVLLEEPWVKDLVNEGREAEIGQTIKDAMDYKFYATMPKKLQEVLQKLGAVESETMAGGEEKEASGHSTVADGLPLDDWGQQIKELAADFPCVKEALGGLPLGGYAAGLFVSAAFLGTLMTRTWYYFYHRPEEMRRLNYCVMVIGDPASGKSFATRLYKLLAAPIKTADKVGYEAVNRYKEDTRSKGANKEKPKKPQVVIRDHPARTSNATFIQDMNNAVETVDGQPMHLHLLTFDSELDNATLTQRGGSWIDKSSLELKAFHNEEDGQAYSNLDSISGTFNVYWNYVYTGTPLSLQRKVTERNFGSGLATRLAVIPLPPSGFQMMGLQRRQTIDHQADETLKTWAFRLDGVKGELPLWPLVEECWHWTDERMFAASLEKDKADELLLKRVAYYGICISAPFILMRHWDEWKKNQTFEIDDTDRRLCRLVLNIQYRCQHYFFEGYARAYFENMERDQSANRQRPSKYDECYKKLPQEFSIKDVMETYEISSDNAKMTAKRLFDNGFVERLKRGNYRKLKQTLI